jgi:hypothetical protein
VKSQCLGTWDPFNNDLNEQKFLLSKRKETKRYFSINETIRNDFFFGTETENRNEINIFQKRNETEKKIRFLTSDTDFIKKNLSTYRVNRTLLNSYHCSNIVLLHFWN